VPRLGVVALLPEPISAHVQAWRRALREPFRDAVPPHITLVPPQQVPSGQMDDAIALVRETAGSVMATVIELGGAESFLPRSPVAYLAVIRGADVLTVLEERLRTPPLDRRGYPFHPHVTVAVEGDERIQLAVAELAGFSATFRLEEIALLREEGGMWRRQLTAPLGGTAAVAEVPFTQAVSASVLLVKDDAVLLGRRTLRPGSRYPGSWDALGGKPDPGEPLLAALIREAREEAGVEPLDVTAVGCFHDGTRADAVWAATTWRGEIVNAAPDEHDLLEWVPLGRAAELPLVPAVRAALTRLTGGRPGQG
jgi:8-oxo-dGTP pyrophosphatase MutT (NUDIX family)/2'-5' RNA ligase